MVPTHPYDKTVSGTLLLNLTRAIKCLKCTQFFRKLSQQLEALGAKNNDCEVTKMLPDKSLTPPQQLVVGVGGQRRSAANPPLPMETGTSAAGSDKLEPDRSRSFTPNQDSPKVFNFDFISDGKAQN